MKLITGQQSTADVVNLATGSAEVNDIYVYNSANDGVSLQLRAYDKSKDLHITLQKNNFPPGITVPFQCSCILNSGDELYTSGNSSNHNLHYTYGISGDSNKTFVALHYDDTAAEQLSESSFAPIEGSIKINSFNTTSDPASNLILQARDYDSSLTNNELRQDLAGGSHESTSYPPFNSWDFSLADNEVAHPFDLAIYYDKRANPAKEYGSFMHNAGTQQIGNFSNIYVQKQFQIYNITRGTANPVDVHIQFRAYPVPSDSNRIQVTGTDIDSNGNVTDAYIAWYQEPNTDWATISSNGGGWDFWDVGSYRNQDGSIKGTAVNSIGYSGTAPGYTRDNSATGYIEIQFFLEGQFTTRPVPAGTPYQRLMTTANTTYTNINNGSGRSCIGGAGRQCGMTPAQITYYTSFVPYDSVRGGYWLDLAGDGPPVSQAGWF